MYTLQLTRRQHAMLRALLGACKQRATTRLQKAIAPNRWITESEDATEILRQLKA